MSSPDLFQLPDPAYEEHRWVLWDEHGPSSSPPLLLRNWFDGPVAPGEPPRALVLHGFTYVRQDGANSGRGGFAGGGPAPRNVAELRYWREEWLPQVERICRSLEEFEPRKVEAGRWAATLQYQEQSYMRVFGGIHATAPGPAHAAANAFTSAFTEKYGAERREDMHALLQGVPNCSLDRAAGLWDLSRLLRQHPEVVEALDRGAEIPDSDGGREFASRLSDFMDIYGYTSNTDLQDLPLWREDRAIPLAAIRAYARKADGQGPRDAAERQRQRRLQLEQELKEAARDDSDVAEILRLLPMAQELIPNLEDHNFLADQRMIAASRARWMAVGGLLQEQGLIETPDDVFYFTKAEIVPVLEGKMPVDKEILANRRRDLRLARAWSPPPVLGKIVGEAQVLAPQEVPDGLQTLGGVKVLRGGAASPGSISGRARVIETLEEAATLEAGDILVVRTTTPPWTPFFALAAAIVTNSGGVLSHAAVVAREMGIPAVVGTGNGTAQVTTGQVVTVDGTNGLVLIEEAPQDT